MYFFDDHEMQLHLKEASNQTQHLPTLAGLWGGAYLAGQLGLMQSVAPFPRGEDYKGWGGRCAEGIFLKPQQDATALALNPKLTDMDW
mmetsp:Transcript_51586/g.92062  ORF Transcript_51586/g.92062 Transcript_51586/m.92062 type:complete len:88 (-) Transcript_51586:43-306(-)